MVINERKKITFPKSLGFKRCKKYDFSDDGNYFIGYTYKDLIVVTALSRYKNCYVSIRFDYESPNSDNNIYEVYNSLSKEKQKEIRELSWEFNGVSVSCYDPRKLAENCEKIINILGLLEENNNKDYVKPLYEVHDKENIRKMINYYNNGSSLKRIISALRSEKSYEKFIDRFYITRYIRWGDVEDWLDIADKHNVSNDILYTLCRQARYDSEVDAYHILDKLIN